MHTVTTACPSLDDLLDGGLESDAITLVFGEGGSGKTNLALQCARTVAAGGQRVAYVDTEGVSQKRLRQVFDALPDDAHAAAEGRLLFFKPYTIEEQEKMVKATASLPDVGLIVVDSINMHYRLHIDAPSSEKEASRSLYQQLHHLTMHARRNHIPVLVTGQVYGGENTTQPFARRVMEHLVKALVRFEKRPDGSRRATVLKHRSIEEGRQARFRIGAHGLEDLDGGQVVAAPSPRRDVAPEAPPAPATGQEVDLDPSGDDVPPRLRVQRRADAGPDSDSSPVAGDADVEEPAVRLLTDRERAEAEALPGFTSADAYEPDAGGGRDAGDAPGAPDTPDDASTADADDAPGAPAVPAADPDDSADTADSTDATSTEPTKSTRSSPHPPTGVRQHPRSGGG